MPEKPFDVSLPPFKVEKEYTVRSSESRPYSWGVGSLSVKEVWDRSTGTGVIAFVVDTEGKTQHPDVISSVVPEYCKRFTNEPAEIESGHGHGLHVADTILQCAPGTLIGLVKVLTNEGSGYSTWVSNGIRFVADLELLPHHQGFKKVINLSLGSNTASPVIKAAIEYARSKNVEVFAAAGNDAGPVDYPGAFDDLVITVAAIDQNERPAYFTSFGPEVSLTAPGVGIHAAWGPNGYASLSGTSMATPHAAGIGSLILSKYPDVQLESFLTMFAKDTHDPGRDDWTGYGIPIATGYFNEDTEPEPEPEPEPPLPDPIKPWVWLIVGGISLTILYLVIFR